MCEAFDAATTRAGYNQSPATPAAVVETMREEAHRHLDPVVVLTFTDMLGAYPVGTVLMLDSFELAISHSVNPNPDFARRPMALIISDIEGMPITRGFSSTSASATTRGTSRGRSSKRSTRSRSASGSETISSERAASAFGDY